jgi:hypothetical protein
MAAVGADAWAGLPLADASAGLVLVAFAPRPLAEIARVPAPGGALVVATPAEARLAELSGPLGTVRVDPAKDERIARAMPDVMVATARTRVRARRALGRDEITDVLAMGPMPATSTPPTRPPASPTRRSRSTWPSTAASPGLHLTGGHLTPRREWRTVVARRHRPPAGTRPTRPPM